MSKSFAALLLVLLGAGCETVEQDKFVSQGGISPDPSARIEGTVMYLGPRPGCDYDEAGRPNKVKGRVILTMFAYNNPPPPEGSATTSLNLLSVNGGDLFALTDCLPNGAAQDPEERIIRSAPFAWPKIPLAPGAESSFQVRGFYDSDADMVPFFSVTRIPTEGDVVGAALNDLQDASKGFLRITVPSFESAKNGYVLRGITVTLGNVVRSERPAFKLDENRRLNAETPFTPVPDTSGLFGPASLRSFRLATCVSGGTDGASCGLTLQRFAPEQREQLRVLGVELETTSPGYFFFAEPVDIRTVVPVGTDIMVPDGLPDPHPFLAGLGLPWYTPMVLMTRYQTPTEAQAKIPPVIMIGSVLFDSATRKPTQSSYASAPIGVPPVAAVELRAGFSECRIPYFPRTSSSLVIGTGTRLAQCTEIPSGYYAVNVLGGIAGGTVGPIPAGTTSDSPRFASGARYAAQLWSIPNELALPEQVGSPADAIADQGLSGAFMVFDPDPNSPSSGSCPAPAGAVPPGVCESGFFTIDDPGTLGILGADSPGCLPQHCCEAVKHLCDVPRCASAALPEGGFVAGTPNAVDLKTGKPNCIPFEMPVQCCPAPT